MQSYKAALSLILAVVTSTGVAQNLIVNGGFELPSADREACQLFAVGTDTLPGWSIVTDDVATCPGYGVRPASGTSYLDLAGFSDSPPHGGVSQTIATVVGQSYVLAFELGAAPNGLDIYLGPIRVEATAGATTQQFTHTPINDTGWSLYTLAFTASASTTPITLQGLSGNALIGLDNVSVVAQSTPSVAPATAVPTLSGHAPLSLIALIFVCAAAVGLRKALRDRYS